MVQFTINGHRLEFWIELSDTEAVIWVRREGDDSEKYRVFGVGSQGVCWRYPGLPLGWGFRLTRDRKIKEIH